MPLNCDFHNIYSARVQDIQKTFGETHGRPVILSLGDRVILKSAGKREEFLITPAPYSDLKAFSHAMFSIYLILSNQKPGELVKETQTQLQELTLNLRHAKGSLYALHLDDILFSKINELYDLSLDFVNKIQLNKKYNQNDLKSFYKQINPDLLSLNHYCAKLEINAVDKVISPWLQALSTEMFAKLAIVVATSHQARARNIMVEYFAKKFNKNLCIGAFCDDGMLILEDKFDEQSAQMLLARHYLDKEASRIIFNDAKRLQYDLLAK